MRREVLLIEEMIDIANLADRLCDEDGDERITALGPLLGTWARRPG